MSHTVAFLAAPGSALDDYDGSKPFSQQSSTIPQTFLDAMQVRYVVYVVGQSIPVEIEFDDMDKKCWHWVAYDAEKRPVGTVRLVPPMLHAATSTRHAVSEPYIKLGRLAVDPQCRKGGLASLLTQTALEWAARHAKEVSPVETWTGLTLVHAQTSAEGFWAKNGFVTDKSMGTWEEADIPHVGMWTRVGVKTG